MFAADPDLQIWSSGTAAIDTDPHNVADTFLINRLERIVRDDVVLTVETNEWPVIVAADCQRRLGQVVGTETEELSGGRDLVRSDSRPRNFDHSADEVFQRDAGFLEDRFRFCANDLFLILELGQESCQRNHHFRNNADPFLLNENCGFENRSGLHRRDFGINDPETATAVTEHRVRFVQFFDASFHSVDCAAGPTGQLGSKIGLFFEMAIREELVKRWIEQADRHGTTVHAAEQTCKVSSLEWQQLGESLFTGFLGLTDDHVTDFVEMIEEHMLGSTESNPFSPERNRFIGLSWCVGIGSHSQLAILVDPTH